MDTAAEELNIDVSIEEDGPSARKLAITVPAETVDERIESAFDLVDSALLHIERQVEK